MSLKIGSLCTGYGGLDMAVEAVLDARTAWVSDIDKGACKVLGHRYPGVPNLGDMTAIDWSQVEPVDVITGGTPCQDLSHAGKRAGMTEGTRSNLWVAMREAIATIRPSLVIWENVDGAASAAADSDLERNPGLLAGVRRRGGQPVLRALGRVVGDLSSLGYVGSVGTIRAGDVGAPHRRTRRFLAAVPAADTRLLSREVPPAGRLAAVPEPAGDGDSRRALLPTPRATDGTTKGGPNQRGSSGDLMLPSAVALLPTPTQQDGANTGGPSQFERHTRPLNTEVLTLPANLLATPTVAVATGGPPQDSKGKRDLRIDITRDWGQYSAAIARWELLTRPAPSPTELGPRGGRRLSPPFVEWMMGLPAGWITDVPGVTRNEALKLCGNGVVPQQAAAALRFLLPLITRQVAA